MKKYWYIWLSVFAMMALLTHSQWKVRKRRGEKIGKYMASKTYDLYLKLTGHAFVLAFTALFPSMLLGIGLCELLSYHYPWREELFRWIPFITFYFGGVWATWRHVKWREKYLSTET